MTKSAKISFFLFLGLLTQPVASAAPNSLLKCLGEEEERYHKMKVSHSRARLNTEVITDLAQTGELSLKSQYYREICGSQEKYPAERLLEMQLLHGTEIFEIYGNNREIKYALLVEYQKSLPQVFLRHLGNLQSELETPNCLDKKIPALKRIKEKIKYTEEETSGNALLPLKKEVKTTFQALKSFQRIKLECKLKENPTKKRSK